MDIIDYHTIDFFDKIYKNKSKIVKETSYFSSPLSLSSTLFYSAKMFFEIRRLHI